MRISDWSSDVCSSDLHGAEIAQAHDLLVGVMARGNARSLRRHVGAQAEQATTGRIGELEDLLLDVLRRTGQQRIEMLDQRRMHELVTTLAIVIEQLAAQIFNLP